MDNYDPRAIIFSYLDDLPKTIRTEALLFVMMYVMDRDIPHDIEAFAEIVRQYLMRTGMPGISAVVCGIAAIDHSFEGIISKLDSSEVGLKISGAAAADESGITSV